MSMYDLLTEAIRLHTTDAYWTPEGLAQAVMEAMSEPTEAMLENGAAMNDMSGHPLDIWQAMIAAAADGAGK